MMTKDDTAEDERSASRTTYPCTYRDRLDEERTAITNDGQYLRTVLRGVKFEGSSVMGLEPTDKTERPELASFTLNRFDYEAAELCACVIDYEVVLAVSVHGQETEALLTVHSELGVPNGNGSLDSQTLRLALHIGGKVKVYEGSGRSGWFEDEMLEIQAVLPEGVYIKACINCAFSDYSVYGHDVFGDMACFRNRKTEYLQVKTKADYMGMKGGPIESVQETYLCPEFERRRPGTGYRG